MINLLTVNAHGIYVYLMIHIYIQYIYVCKKIIQKNYHIFLKMEIYGTFTSLK